MSSSVIRVLAALLFAVLLWAQARAAHAQPHRRRAFSLAAGALLIFAAYNAAVAAGAQGGLLQTATAIVGLALLAGAMISLVASLRAGEMADQRDRVAAAAKEYRERREEQTRTRR
jgi:hypothetical protein